MEKSIVDILEKTAKKYPDKVAVKDINTECTFSELVDCAKKIGTQLIKENVTGEIIPVFMEKSVLTLQIFVGITYAGKGYSLVNPMNPIARIKQILDTLEATVVITDSEHVKTLESTGYEGRVILTDSVFADSIDEEALKKAYDDFIDMTPLYVNFTSGSTGVPKGVAVGHKSVIEFIHYFTEIFEITEKDIIGNQAPFDFDVSVKDIYSSFMTGATLVIIPKEYFMFPQKLLEMIDGEKVTTLIWAVSALCIITSLRGFDYIKPLSVNKVMFSGEVMPPKHLEAWMNTLPDATFVNLYGPTEITCNCTYYIIGDEYNPGDKIPIGKAFPNERVFLLDENNKLVTECGVEGEVCVGGSTLALGYYNNAEKTSEVFVRNPVNTRYPETIYRTGDIAIIREDGNFMYVGRRDFQIKHLGRRIELGEIEANMGVIEGITRVCCLYDHDKQQIVAIYSGTADKKTIKAELKRSLIKYMIPEKYIVIDEFPLTANGKINKKELKNLLSGDN